jgi:predicted N-acetyltransferase YhbS
MDVKLRPGTPDDAEVCGRICYDAFATLAAAHGFACDFPSPEAAIGLVSALFAHPGIYGVVAEIDGAVVGSNFLDERAAIAGVGPITVDPVVRGAAGRHLMLAVMDRAAKRGKAGVRLVQAAYNTRSLALYAKLGFEVRETLACLQGPPLHTAMDGYTVRAATDEDLEACNQLCQAVHGHDRSPQVSDAIFLGKARIVEHDGRPTGYSTGLSFWDHSVGERDDDIKALIAAADAFGGPGFLVPMRNTALFRFCLDHGLRVVQVMTLMTTGRYQEPQGAYLPSIMY